MPVRVLQVHRDQDPFKDAESVLKDEGIEVDIVETSTDAIQKLEETMYDLVLSGYRLSEGDGLELLESVRDRYPELPFIIYTAEQEASVASQAISTGVTDYLLTQETDSADQLVDAVRRHTEAPSPEEGESGQSVYVELLEKSPAPIAVYDDDGELVYVNDSAAELMEARSREEMLGRPATDFVHPSDREWARERLNRVIRDREDVEGTELKLRTLEGNKLHAHVSTEPVTYDGRPAGQTVLYDVTEIVEKEHELKEEEQYRIRLHEIMSEKTLSTGEKIRRVLQLGVSRLGVEHGHLVRIDREEGTHEVVEVSGPHAIVEKGAVTGLETTYCRKTVEAEGSVAVKNAPEEGLEDDPAYLNYGFRCYIGSKIKVDDELYGTLCFVDNKSHPDFTHEDKIFVDLMGRWVSHELERAHHRLELEREKELYRTLVDSVDNYAIYRLDEEGMVVSWNEGATRIKGYTEREAMGMRYSEFYTEEERSEGVPEQRLSTAREEGKVEAKGWRVRNDGSKYWADETVTALWDDELRGYSVVTRDLTEQKWMEERKNVTEDVLTHNTRNWANVILGGAETLSEDVEEPGDTVEECIRMITESAIDILELNETSRIIQESMGEGGENLPTQRIDVAELLREKLENVKETDPDLEIEFDSPETQVVETSRHLGFAAEKLIMDIVVNNPPPRPLLEISVRHSGDTAVIRFTDNGSGFPEEEFDMIDTEAVSEFYESGGVWIWLMKWIVKESGGNLEVTEGGSTVKLTLPRN